LPLVSARRTRAGGLSPADQFRRITEGSGPAASARRTRPGGRIFLRGSKAAGCPASHGGSPAAAVRRPGFSGGRGYS
jgi:hypothetical protein